MYNTVKLDRGCSSRSSGARTFPDPERMPPFPSMSDSPTPTQPASSAPRAPLRETLAELWNDYPWTTRSATILLAIAALLNMALAAELLPSWPLLAAGSSDGALTLLTLLVALGVGLHIKSRQLKGLLDGTDHYDIGRALAFGYFSNFLVPALVLLRGESRKTGAPLVLRMVFPRNVRELDHFKETIEPALRALAGKRDLEGVYRTGAGVIKRSLLVLAKAPGKGDDGIFFDFPTTLYTLHDYYETWNLWLEEQDKPPIREQAISDMQEKQIQAFLRHLEDLSRSEVGLQAVAHLGVTELPELTQLFDEHFRTIEPRELPELLAAG